MRLGIFLLLLLLTACATPAAQRPALPADQALAHCEAKGHASDDDLDTCMYFQDYTFEFNKACPYTADHDAVERSRHRPECYVPGTYLAV